MAFNPSRPAGLVSGSLKFLLSSLLLSEATVCAPSDKLAHVHLLGLAFLYLSLSLSLLSHCCRPRCFVCESGRRFSRNFLWLSLWLSRASVSVTLSPLAFSFPYPDVIATNPPRRHRSRKSSLIFVFFRFLPNSPLVTSPFSLRCLLPLSPAKRVRRYSLECHFCSNLR